MSRNYYTLQDLEKLQAWITKKVESIPNDAKAGDEYSEANLSKSVLSFIQFLVEKELNNRYISPHMMTDPHYYYPPYTTTTAPNTLTLDQKIETICTECKAKNPNMTCCIHRITLNSSSTTGE